MRKLVSLSRRTGIALAVTLAAASAATTAVVSAADATPGSGGHHGSACDVSTLKGSYLFGGTGTSVSGSTSTALAFAGIEVLDGAGGVRGVSTTSANGVITRHSPFTGRYTVSADCTGTLTIGTGLHFQLFIAPSGDTFAYIQTDPGSVSATTEQRATRTTGRPSCSLATLRGTYLVAGNSLAVSGGITTPVANAGVERFDGAGHVSGTLTTSTNGVLSRNVRYTTRYTVAADCLITESVPLGGTTSHYDLYVSPDGNTIYNIQTDPGSVSFLIERRVSR